MRTLIFIFLAFFGLKLTATETEPLFYPFPPPKEEIERFQHFFDEPNGTLAPLSLEDRGINTKADFKASIIQKSRSLEAHLNKKVLGQEHAVKETAHAIMRFAAGVNDPSTPIASLLFCGPSGVGKTELAIQLCLQLYGKKEHFVRINMSEYTEPFSITRLIGSPPGYIGYENGGGLSNRLLDNPYAVVLLDEIEKAHPKILKLFMHVFDAGYFTSAQGHDVDCRKAIFILTSNLGSREIANYFQEGLDHHEILDLLQPELMNTLSPELYNRLDCTVFYPLTDAIFEQLIRKILDELHVRVYQSKKIDLLFEQSIIDYLKTFTLDPRLGARPLKRVVEKQLTTTLAKAIIERSCKAGDALICTYAEGKIGLHIVLSDAD